MAKSSTRKELEQRIKVLEDECAKGNQAAEGLVQERNFISTILDTAGALVVVLDREGRITRFNRACEQVTGYSAKEVSGRIFWEFLVPPEDLQGVVETWEALKAGDFPKQHENRWVAKNGSRRTIAWSNTAAVNPHGEVEHIIGTGIDITERKQAEELIRQNAEQHRAILETAIDGFWLADVKSGRILEVNDAFCRMNGYSKEELLSMHISDLEATETIDDIALHARRIVAKGEDRFESRHRRKDGSLIDVEVSVQYRPTEDGRFVGFFRDITDRKRAEKEALNRKNTELNSFINNIPDLAWIKDSESKFIAVNKAFVQIVGMPPELLPKNSSEVCLEEEVGRKFREDDRKVMRSKRQTRIEEEIVDSRKRKIWFETIRSPILDDAGRVLGTVGIAHDITDRIRGKEILEQSERKLRLLSSHLLSAHEAERERISKELHDQLGQDLIGLKLHVGSIQRKLCEGKTAVDQEFESVKGDIDEIIENVRRLSRDLGPYALEHLGLWQALRYLTDELAKHYPVKTSFDILSSDHRLPQSTQHNIFRVFQEALTNIQKHADATQISIEVGEKDGHFRFLIEDDGKGFDVTQVVEDTPSEKGLGLVIMEERVRSLGGAFDVWSQEGKGTRISFTVPVGWEERQE